MLREMDDPASGDITVVLDATAALVVGRGATDQLRARRAGGRLGSRLRPRGGPRRQSAGARRPLAARSPLARLDGHRELLDTLARATPNAERRCSARCGGCARTAARWRARTILASWPSHSTASSCAPSSRCTGGLAGVGRPRGRRLVRRPRRAGGAARAALAAPATAAATATAPSLLLALAAAGVLCLTLRHDDDLRPALSFDRLSAASPRSADEALGQAPVPGLFPGARRGRGAQPSRGSERPSMAPLLVWRRSGRARRRSRPLRPPRLAGRPRPAAGRRLPGAARPEPLPARLHGLGAQYDFYLAQLRAGAHAYVDPHVPLPPGRHRRLKLLLALIVYIATGLASFAALSLRRPLPAIVVFLVLLGFSLTVDGTGSVVLLPLAFLFLAGCLLALSRSLQRGRGAPAGVVAGAGVAALAALLALVLLGATPVAAGKPWRDWSAWGPFGSGPVARRLRLDAQLPEPSRPQDQRHRPDRRVAARLVLARQRPRDLQRQGLARQRLPDPSARRRGRRRARHLRRAGRRS